MKFDEAVAWLFFIVFCTMLVYFYVVEWFGAE